MIALWNSIFACEYSLILLEHVHQRMQFGQLRLGHIWRGEPGGHAFDRRPDGDHLDHLTLRLPHHQQTAPWYRADETLLFQDRQCLADRCPAHPKILGKLALVQPDLERMTVAVHLGDGALDRLARLSAQTDADGERFEPGPRDRNGILQPVLQIRRLDRTPIEGRFLYTTYIAQRRPKGKARG